MYWLDADGDWLGDGEGAVFCDEDVSGGDGFVLNNADLDDCGVCDNIVGNIGKFSSRPVHMYCIRITVMPHNAIITDLEVRAIDSRARP